MSAVLTETKRLALAGEDRNDDTQDAERSLLLGLEQFLHARYLGAYVGAAAAWCDRMGACLLEEVEENLEDLAAELALKPLERKRLLGAPRRKELPAEALHVEPCPEPREESDATPAIQVTPWEPSETLRDIARGAMMKNTFIHVAEDLPFLPLSRGETCPAATTFLLQQALTRLVSGAQEAGTAWAAAADTPADTPCETPRGYCDPRPRGEKTTVDVPDRRIGALIGKRGAALRELEARTGAAVSVAKEPRNRDAPKELQVRVVAVAGSAAAVAAAVREIRAAVEEPARRANATLEIWEAQVKWVVGDRGKTIAAIEAESGATISIPKQGWARTVTIRGDAAACDRAEHMIECMLPYTKEFYDVPAWKIGSLLGVRGETIRRIEAWSGATVSVPREGELRTVVLCGDTEESVLKAAGEVEAVLAAARQASRSGKRRDG